MGVTRWAGLLVLPALVLAGVGPSSCRPADRRIGVVPTTVTAYGRDGAFGALADRLPSGQRLARVAVSGFGLPPGWQADTATVAADGSVVVAGRPAEPANGAAALGPFVGVFDPATNGHTTLALPGATGQARVADVEPVGRGVAVLYGGPDLLLTMLNRVDG